MNRTLTIFLLVVGILLSRCSRFDEWNTDPNNASVVSPSLLATDLILGVVKYPSVGKDFLYKDMLAKYISYMEGATNYQYNKLERADFYSLIKLVNVQKMNEAAKGTVYENSYNALGHFIRAYTFFRLTLMVGDIPYTDALKGEQGVYNPSYESQRDVILGLLDELETADSLFAIGRNFEGDPVFEGDVIKWRRATNALSLKILTHLWNRTGDKEFGVIDRFRKICSSGNLMQSNNDNFQLVYGNQQVEYYPFFNSNFRKYPIMSTTITDQMKALGDYRLFYFAEPAPALIASGKKPEDWDAYAGVNPSDDFNDISAKYVAGEVSGINLRYYELETGEPTYLLSYAEQQFIIAEGILRGWFPGDTSYYYQEGIRAALEFVASNTPDNPKFHHNRRINEEVIAQYLNSAPVILSGSIVDKLHQVFLQRYFLGFMQDGIDSYFENRRTGYPLFPVNEQTNLNSLPDRMPRRWMYPAKELSCNREELQKAIDRQFGGNDDVNETMWILQ